MKDSLAVARMAVLPLLAVSLAACGDSSSGPDPQGIRIIAFSAEPSRIQSGSVATLSWEVAGANGVSIEPTVGLQPVMGTAEVRPFVTTTYTLTVRAGNDELTSKVTVEVEGGPPRIDSFVAMPRTILLGEASRLEWACSNTTEVTIEPGLGTQASSGSLEVRPEVTTTYTLTAVGSNGTASSELTVVVASGNQPFIRDFSASKATIMAGEMVDLTWDTLNTDSVVIDNGVGTQGPSGTVQVSPTQTTIYNLTAVGPGGSANASVTVVVEASGTPVILEFKATPSTIAPGGESELSWETDNALSVQIDNGVGQQNAKGSIKVQPAQTTTYKLTAFGPSEMVTQEVTVTVAGANDPVVLTFDAQPRALVAGGSTTLSWTTQNATSVDIDNGAGTGLAASGSVQVSPTQTTTYSLTARGSGTPATGQVTVTVTPPAPSVTSFTALPTSITSGQMSQLAWNVSDATSVDIDNGVGTGLPANGTASVSPTQTTQYRLNATGPGGTTMAVVTLTVAQVGAPVISAFTASPQTINLGASTTLSWNTQNATTVSIDNGVGAQSATGSVQVSPNQTTTYTLSAMGPGGTTNAQLTVTVAAPQNGDQCTNPLVISASGTFSGNTQSAINDYQDSNTCTGFRSTGPDTVYRISLAAGDRLRASLQPSGTSWDASLYMVTSCSNVAQSCVAGQDNGNPEEIDYTAANAGDFYLIVDGFNGAGGTYNLTINLNPAPVPNDQCMGAINATAGGVFTGDTTNAIDHYSPGSGGCTGFAAAARDVTYRVTLQAGERLQASLNAAWDASLYVVTDCAQASSTCVAGQDNGNPEEIDFMSPAGGTYFLIVDGFSAASGTFSLTVSISPPVVGGETCQNAVPVPVGGGSFQSTTQGAINDYDPPIECTGFANAGPDRVYAANLIAGEVVEVLAELEAGLDGSVYVVTDCAALSSCVAGADDELAGGAEELRFVAAQAGPHYVVVDAEAAGSAGAHDLTIASYRGDVCTDAIPLLLGGQTERFTTTGLTDDYSPNSGGCTGYSASGEDRVYSVSLQAGDQLQVTIDADGGWDPALYVVSNCSDITGSCIQGRDTIGFGGVETVAPVVQQAGVYYVMVDAFNGADGGGTISARVARGDTCADAYVVPTGGGTFQGTTTGYAANVGTNSATGSCTNWQQDGADAIYAVALTAGQRITASLNTSWDGALYLVSDCAQAATTCVAGQDNGNPEDIDFTATTAGTYYLVVDSWRAGATYQGNYSLSIAFP